MTELTRIEPRVETSATLALIERMVLNPAADMDKLERLLAMQEKVLERQAKAEYITAMAGMQEEMPVIDKNGRIEHNGKLMSHYAKYDDIISAIKPVLSKFGLMASHRISQADGKITVTAVVSHRGGHSEETSITLPADTSGAKNAVQSQGSSLSYGQRYTLCALLNIATRDMDDDGVKGGAIPHEQAVEIDQLVTKVGADKPKFLAFMGVSDVRDIPAKDYRKAINALNSKKKGGGDAAKA